MRVVPRCDVDGQMTSIVLFQIAVSLVHQEKCQYFFLSFSTFFMTFLSFLSFLKVKRQKRHEKVLKDKKKY